MQPQTHAWCIDNVGCSALSHLELPDLQQQPSQQHQARDSQCWSQPVSQRQARQVVDERDAHVGHTSAWQKAARVFPAAQKRRRKQLCYLFNN